MPGTDQKVSFLGVISQWGISRNPTSEPTASDHGKRDILQRSQGEDHTVTRRYRLNQRHYPKDCPTLRVRWFYAVDSPKRKPTLSDHKKDNQKPLPSPKKFVPFSSGDSQSIEIAFQKLSDLEDRPGDAQFSESPKDIGDERVRVPVNEDYLFDVDIEHRELSPAYWVGPVYEVRRGTWFFQEGSTFKPCEENLATQLEEGFLKVRPWRFESAQKTLSRATSSAKGNEHHGLNVSNPESVSGAPISTKITSACNSPEGSAPNDVTPLSAIEPQSYRLFGAYMNSIVTYQDSSTAWLTSDDFMSRVSTTVYQKLGGVPGTKIVRGFSETKRLKEPTETKNAIRKPPRKWKIQHETFINTQTVSTNIEQKIDSCPPRPRIPSDGGPENRSVAEENPRTTLERQMSSLAGEPQDMADIEEQARRQEEKEMEDSREVDNEDREREIDHLVLVTHGIGQRLGLRLESINFIHDVNSLRKTLKSVYKASPGLQTLNSSFADNKRNCRVQVLPVCWRHLLDFPYRGFRQTRKEHDLADADYLEDDVYPTLADVTLEGVPSVRNLISDLAMDVLLYQSAYCDHIATIVQQECNRIFKLFKKRNPSFKGSVSLCGHSLGSAIFFDILCHQQNNSTSVGQDAKAGHRAKTQTALGGMDLYPLDFECEELFCLGSPIALFQMLKGKTIAGRSTLGSKNGGNTIDIQSPAEIVHRPSAPRHSVILEGDLNDISPTVSSPNCRRLYNIFHPSDPVSYRIEPLISPAMAALKPQPLPSVKKSLWTASGQSLSVIGTRVGQSVGSLWTNFTSGVASSLLNRSLGLGSEDAHQTSTNVNSQPQQTQPPPITDLAREKQSHPASNTSDQQEDDNTLETSVDQEFETLYCRFQDLRSGHRRGDSQPCTVEGTADSQEMDDRARKLKIEDAKVRALNSNGRVDYSLQEGTFDISLIASIASHLSYWADEDVNHFMLSQMLSRKNWNKNTKQASKE
ncbi:hypothetical protein MPDQ_001127 [Monascus purpureus]|uniref:DDHD domain-containing protein n=1 Tax=Monascus purpureus TaxID=5098 RepID=A0A507QSF5_MONPU|nr:hypothetical protein MPDQ_001127 [Monascus purpureus]BDD60533.1 hypothetical protein MAP00_005657 [Monascus purpureus]